MVANLLKQTYEKLICEHNEESILGVAVSPQKEENMIRIVGIYIPTKEDLYSIIPFYQEKQYDSTHVVLIDIRDIINHIPDDIKDVVNIFQSKNFFINPSYQDLLLDYCKMYSNSILSLFLFGNFKKDNNFTKIISELIIKVIKFRNEEKEQSVNFENFIISLTQTEKAALKIIYEIIGQEGYISVSQIIERYGISRPVFTNLFYKIKESQVGQIDNRGVKGTYISFCKDIKNIIDKII